MNGLNRAMLGACSIGRWHGSTNISVWTGAELAEVGEQPAGTWRR